MFFGFRRGWPKRDPEQRGRQPESTRTILHYLADASVNPPPQNRSASSPREKPQE